MKTFEEVFESLPSTGWLTEDEARLLWYLATTLPGDILEIGTYCGRSAKLFAHAVQDDPLRRLYCCDPILEGFDNVKTPSREGILESIAEHVLSTETALQVHLCCMTEEKLHAYWKTPLSLVYIDSNHSFEATRDAILRWKPLTKVLALHDFGGGHPGVAQAVRALGLGSPTKLAGRVAVF